MCNKLKEFCTVKNLFITICTILAGYLVGKAVFKFVVIRPTSTSNEVVELDAETIPDVVICGDPAIDQNSTKSYGYKDPAAYWHGSKDSWGGLFFGWNGKEGQNNSTEIRDDLLNVKMGKGLVDLDQYVLLKERDYQTNNLPAEFMMVTFPYGRCQVLKPPKDLKFSERWLWFNETTVKHFSSLNILLMDPVNSPLVFPANFQMRGSPISVELNDHHQKRGWYPYQVKVSQSRHVQDNPQYDCKEYSLNDTYGECIKEEWKARFLKLLNCTPPLLDASQMCDNRFALNWTESTYVYELIYHWTYGTECNSMFFSKP